MVDRFPYFNRMNSFRNPTEMYKRLNTIKRSDAEDGNKRRRAGSDAKVGT